MPESRHRTLKVVVFLCFATATLLIGISYDRYEPVGPEILINADFSRGLDGWRLKGPSGNIVLEEPGTVRLHTNKPNTHVSLTQSIDDPRRFVLVRLSADMRTEGVVAGQRNWQKARLIMSSFDGKGRWVPAPHHVNSLVGSHPWKRYEQVFRIIPEAGKIDIAAQLDRAMGTLWIKDLSLRKVVQNPTYAWLQAGFFGLWGLFFVWLLAPSIVGSGGRILWRGMVLVSVLVVLAGTLIPGGQRGELEKGLLSAYQSVAARNLSRTAAPAEKVAPDRTEVRDQTVAEGRTVAPVEKRVRTIELWERMRRATKAGHFVVFGLLGLSLAGALPASPPGRLFLDIAMLAGATEVLQFFIEDRMPLLGDWLLDLAGGIAGLALMSLWRRSRRSSPA